MSAADYTEPWQIELRERSACCVDEECDLSGGFAHAGECEPCSCPARHAQRECPLNHAQERGILLERRARAMRVVEAIDARIRELDGRNTAGAETLRRAPPDNAEPTKRGARFYARAKRMGDP